MYWVSRAVTGRQDEAVASDPGVVARVAAHHLLEQQVGGRREVLSGGAGMRVAHLLDGISREDPGRVHRGVVDGLPFECRHRPSLVDHPMTPWTLAYDRRRTRTQDR